MNQTIKPAHLILADGTVFSGKSMGVEGKTIGEVVFSTSMVGYQEALTDPANYGILLAQTFPSIGNYGVNHFCNESDKVYLNGYIVREICELPSNFRCENTLGSFLKEKNVVGICDIDTRKLTRLIREKGAMNGMITTEEYDINTVLGEIKAFSVKDAVASVSNTEKKEYKAGKAEYHVGILNLGTKQSLVQTLLDRNCDVTLLPYNTSVNEIEEMKLNALIISDGAGDPAENKQVIETVKALMNSDIPMFGLGMGHQVIAIANGAKTQKLTYGHRGANQPVLNLENERTYITTQNHGYVVENNSLNKEICEITFVNANDKTCEGISYKNKPVFSVQFLPDAKESMLSTSYVYDKLFDLMKGKGE